MADNFEFKGSFDAAQIVSEAEKIIRLFKEGGSAIDSTLAGLETNFDKITSRISESVGTGFDQIAARSKKQAENIKSETGGIFSSIQSGFSKLSQITGAVGIFSAGAFGLGHLVKEAQEGRKSITDYRIALLQATGDQAKANQQFEEGERIVAEMSERFNKSGEEIRGALTQITGLGSLTADQAEKVASIGIAFEQLGVPAKALNAILRSTADPESIGALDSLVARFPALKGVIEEVAEPGEKLNAILEKVSPTLQGLEKAALSPEGQIKKLQLATNELKQSLGGVVAEGAEPFIPILGSLAGVMNETVTPAISSVTGFLGEHNELITIAAGGYKALQVAMQIKEAGGLVKFLGEQTKSLRDAATAIITKFIPGLAAKTAAETATAGASAAATGGVRAFATAVYTALGPVGLIIGALTIGIALFAAFSESTKDLSEATAEFKSAQESANAALENKSAVEEKSNQLRSLSSEYDNLSAKQNRNADEEKRLKEVTDQLATAVPKATESIAELDEQGVRTGKSLRVNTDAVRALTAEQERLAKAKADEALLRQEEKAKQLAASYLKAREEQAELREDLKNLEKQIAGGIKNAKVGDFLGIGGSNLNETLDKLDEVNKKIEEADPALASAIQSEVQRGKTIDEVAKKYRLPVDLVRELTGEIVKSDEATKQHVKSAAELAGEFNKAKQDADKLVAQQVSAVAQSQKNIKAYREELKTANAERKAELQELIAKEQESLSVNIKKGRDSVSTQKELNKLQSESEKLLGLGEKKLIDLIAREKALQKVALLRLENERLVVDAGKLSERSKQLLQERDVTGLKIINSVIEKELERFKLTDGTYRVTDRTLQLQIEWQENQKRILTLNDSLLDRLRKIEEAYRAITLANIESTNAFILSLADSTELFDNRTRALNLQIEGTRRAVKLARAEFESRPNTNAFLDAVNEIIDSIEKGIDPTNLLISLETTVARVNEELKNTGADEKQFVGIKDVLDSIQKSFTARMELQKAVNEQLKKEEEQKVKQIKSGYDALNILISAQGLSRVDQLRIQIDAEKALYAQLRQAALDANDPKEALKLQEEYSQKKLQMLGELAKAEQQEFQANQDKIKEIIGSGFEAAFSVANQKFFTVIDKQFQARENVAGAFAAGVVKSLITVAEQLVANLIASQVAMLAATATTTAAMTAIKTAAAPAAFATSVASFGAAPLTAMATLVPSYLSFKGLLGLAQGTITNRPTIAVTSENFQEELTTPLKTARDVLKEEARNAFGQTSGLSRKDVTNAMIDALLAVRERGEIKGHSIVMVSQQENNRMKRRGSR